MKISKILGALSNALIIVSIFIPFISFQGTGSSLWETYNLLNREYIIYVIMACSAISILLFAIGKKIELSYFNGGVVMFFILNEIIDLVKQKGFNLLGIGFYTLLVGEVLLLIMTYLSLREKKEVFE